MKTLVMALGIVGLMTGPALAFRCPSLVKQVDVETTNSFDVEVASRAEPSAYAARALTAEATALHQVGNHVAAMEKMEEAFKLIGLAFQRP